MARLDVVGYAMICEKCDLAPWLGFLRRVSICKLPANSSLLLTMGVGEYSIVVI